MERFHKLILSVIPVWGWIFLASVLVGLIYAAQLVGFTLFDETLLQPVRTRSLHITLMLYGPIMLALSLLPFALFSKDGLNLDAAVIPLRNYFLLWHLFLFMMVISILLGVQRGLPFYDFAYELNFILAGSGIFYIIAIFKTIKQYEHPPLWVKVSKALLFAAPISLILLMNPSYGQVEKTLSGPHGDNTLGMSFTLIPLFYLLIKLESKEKFKAAWHIFWVLPLVAYAISVGLRIFRGELSYNEEWVFQWMTFAYAPLLIKWCKDARLTYANNTYLVISIWAFLFVMIQGNILFIPEIRWFFHRNDLIIAHAHVAIGLGIFFMSLSALEYFYKLPKLFAQFWLYIILFIFIPLTVAGFVEAGMLDLNVMALWWVRLIAGAISVFVLSYLLLRHINRNRPLMLELYHLIGFASDGLGAVLLILFGASLFGLMGFGFNTYYYLVFGFMGFVGILHLLGLYRDAHLMAFSTSLARLITGSIFLSLFYAGSIDSLGVIVGLYDISYALLYLQFRHRL